MAISEPHFIDKFVTLDMQTRKPSPIIWRRNIDPFALYFDPQFTNGAFVINGAGGTPTPMAIYKLQHHSLEMDAGYGNPLLINTCTFASNDGLAETTPNARFTVFLRDMGDKTQFMNQPIHVRTFAWSSQLSARMFEPLFLPTRHVLDVQFNKLVGFATNVYMYMWGQKFLPWATDLQTYPAAHEEMLGVLQRYINRRKQIFPFWLTTETPIQLDANQTLEFDALIGNDGHFEGSHLLYVSNGTFDLQMYDPDKKQTYMNGGISNMAAIGSAQYPQKLAVSMILETGRRLRFKVTDTSGAPNKVFITVRGRRIRAELKEIAQVKKALEVQK